MYTRSLRTLFCIFLFSLIFLAVPSAFGQEASFSVTPGALSIYSKPGQTVEADLTITNAGDPQLFSYSIVPAEPSGNTGSLAFQNESSSIVEFEPFDSPEPGESFLIKNNGTKRIRLEIVIPEDTPQKDYYFAFLTKTNPAESAQGNTISRINLGVANQILLTVTGKGEVEINPGISLFEVLSRYQIPLGMGKIRINDAGDPLQVVLSIENKGKNRITPKGMITVSSLLGKKAYELKSNEILAGATRIIKTAYPKEVPTALSLQAPGLFLGLYRVSASVTFGSATPSIFASTWLIVGPFKLTLFLLNILGVAGFLIIRRRRKTQNPVNE